MPKSADAFRTISEVADWLDTPAHVLRFWESKFSQIKPVKRAGGRRYYRPSDMQLLGGIKKLLHNDGMTIKGVQKILREHGVKHVVALSQALDEVTEAEASEMAEDVVDESPATGTVLSFQRDAEPEPDPKATSKSAGTAKASPPAEPKPKPAPKTKSMTSKASEPDPESVPDAEPESAPALPSFMHRGADSAAKPKKTAKATAAKAPKPAKATVPADPDDTIAADPGALSALAAFDGPMTDTLAEQLTELRDRLSPHLSDGRS